MRRTSEEECWETMRWERKGGGGGGRNVTDGQKHSASFSLGEMKESTALLLPPLPPEMQRVK